MAANTPTYLTIARLIAAGTNTVPALSKARNVSRTRTRAVLTFMRKQRFVESRHGNGLTRYTLTVSIDRIEDHARVQQKRTDGAVEVPLLWKVMGLPVPVPVGRASA